LGGELKEDYMFKNIDSSGKVRRVRLSELFSSGKNSLIVYSFMYGPNTKDPCPACTSILDGLDGCAPHVRDRVNMVIVIKSPINRIMEFAKTRGWENLCLLSSHGTTYNSDYFAENDKGDQIPALNVFTRNDKGIFHFFNTELLYANIDGHPRHVDMIWPIWNLFDMTPEGRGTDWFPRLHY